MQQDSESHGRTLWRSIKHRLEFKARYRLKEEAMADYVTMQQAIKELHHTENITMYLEAEGGIWREAKQGCIPSHAPAFKTNLNRTWRIGVGWSICANNVVMPEDPKHPMNAENAHYKFFLQDIAKMPEDMRKQFYNIRAHLDKQSKADKEFTAFFNQVAEALPAFDLRVTYNRSELPRSEVDDRFRRILRSAWDGKFKRPQ